MACVIAQFILMLAQLIFHLCWGLCTCVDTVIFCADKNTDVIQKRVEEDFSSLSDWLAENELIINCKKGKTEVMMFGTSQ